MKSMCGILAILMAVATPLWAQQDGFSESRFHRIHLRNGNFIDGTVISDKPGEIVLLLKTGEMIIRRDLIEKVELVKMRSWNEKPTILETPKNKVPGTPAGTAPPVNILTPDAVRKQIDKMIARVKSNPNEKEFPADELKETGDEGLAYLATKAANADLGLQNAIMAALVNQKERGPKTMQVLEGFLGGSIPSLRGLALTVLTIDAGEAALAKYVRPALKDPDAGVKIIAISALSAIEDKAWFDDVAESFGDPNKDVRSRALTLCKRLSDKNGLQEKLLAALVAQLRNSDETVRATMVSTIGTLNIAAAWNTVSPMLGDQDATVRASAAQTLQNLGVAESAPEIVAAIKRENDHWARVALANAAARLRIADAVEPLIPWLGAPDPDVQTAVEGALRTITGENLGRDQDKWKAYLQGKK